MNDLEALRQQVVAAEKGDRFFKARGTCQACFNHQAITTDVQTIQERRRPPLVLVLHGYERPGHGYIKGKCPGVGEFPYELSCEFTREWAKDVRTRIVPSIERKLDRLLSGKPERFFIYVKEEMQGASWSKTLVNRVLEEHQVHAHEMPSVIELVEGKEPMDLDRDIVEALHRFSAGFGSNWIGPGFTYPYFRKRELSRVKADLENWREQLAFLEQRIADWVFAPEKLIPGTPTKARSAGQLVRDWLNDRVMRDQLASLPSPPPVPGMREKPINFLDWAESFPRTLAWVSLRGGVRTPSYYSRVLAEYEKLTGEAVSGSIQVSGKKAERLAAKAKAETEKAERAAARTSGAQGKLVEELAAVKALLHNPALEAALRRSSTVHVAWSFDFGIERYGADAPGNIIPARFHLNGPPFIHYPVTLAEGWTFGRVIDEWIARVERKERVDDPEMVKLLFDRIRLEDIKLGPSDVSNMRQQLSSLKRELKAQAKAAGVKV